MSPIGTPTIPMSNLHPWALRMALYGLLAINASASASQALCIEVPYLADSTSANPEKTMPVGAFSRRKKGRETEKKNRVSRSVSAYATDEPEEGKDVPFRG